MELGRAMITLKEAKQTVEDPVKFSSHCPLVQTKRVSFQSAWCDANITPYHLAGVRGNTVWSELPSNSPEVVFQPGEGDRYQGGEECRGADQ